MDMPIIALKILYSDSKSVISIVNNPVQHDWMKHVRIDRHFVKEEIEAGDIRLTNVPTKDQKADIFTKAMQKQGFEVMRDKLEMIDIYSPVWGEVLEKTPCSRRRPKIMQILFKIIFLFNLSLYCTLDKVYHYCKLGEYLGEYLGDFIGDFVGIFCT